MTDWNELTWAVSNATYDAWNARDPDAVAAVFTDDAKVRDSSATDWETGPGPVRDRAMMLCGAMPNRTLTRQILVIDGPNHADRWVMEGTHTGDLLGIAGTGVRLRIEGATFTTIDESGMVIEDVHFVDYSALFNQLDVTG